MIHEVGRELEVRLRVKGCPLSVIDGPEGRGTTTGARERIVIEHDAGDRFKAPMSQHRNPKHVLTRSIACKITIYAQSGRAGAQPFEHRRRAEHVLDLVLNALEYVAKIRKNAWAPTGGAFIQPDDLVKSEIQVGAVYELTFEFDRAVQDRDWEYDAAPEAELQHATISGTPDLTFAADDDTITRSSGSWVDDGFAVGLTVTVAGTDSNDVTGEITALTDTVMTLDTALADEGPVGGCSVSAGGIATGTRKVAVDSTDFETF